MEITRPRRRANTSRPSLTSQEKGTDSVERGRAEHGAMDRSKFDEKRPLCVREESEAVQRIMDARGRLVEAIAMIQTPSYTCRAGQA